MPKRSLFPDDALADFYDDITMIMHIDAVRDVEAAYGEGYFVGVCLACGNAMEGIHPLARRIRCDECEQYAVTGIETAKAMLEGTEKE